MIPRHRQRGNCAREGGDEGAPTDLERNGRDQREAKWDLLSTALLAVCFLGLVLRLWKIGAESLWYDEWFSMVRALDPIDLLVRGDHLRSTPPLYYLLLKPWVLLFGDSEAVLRLPSALAGAAAIPLLARVGRRLFDRATGLSAAFLLAVSPYHVRYSQEARMYSLVVLLGLLSMEFFLASRGRATRWNRAGYILSSAALVYAHYFGGLLLVAQGVVVTVAALRDRAARPAFRCWAGDAAAVALLFSPWLPDLAGQAETAPGRLSWIPDYSSAFMRRVTHALSGPALVLLVALVGLGIVLARRSPRLWFGDRGSWLLVSAWFLVPHLCLVLLTFVAFPLYVVRYAIVGLPAAFLAAAAASRIVRPAALQCALVLVLGAGSLVLTARSLEQADKPQWREAVGWVASTLAVDDLVVVSGFESAYYVDRQPALLAAAVLYQNREGDDRWSTWTADHSRVWYLQQVNWETPAPLAGDYEVRDRREFAQVSVMLFERTTSAVKRGAMQ
jgi:uncharacterized membrane protein